MQAGQVVRHVTFYWCFIDCGGTLSLHQVSFDLLSKSVSVHETHLLKRVRKAEVDRTQVLHN